jgi:hypothetical protein
MERMKTVVFTCLLISGLGLAQDTDYHHNNVVFGVGPAIPVGNTTSYLNPAPLINFGYGYRFNRWFQADAGFQMAFGACPPQEFRPVAKQPPLPNCIRDEAHREPASTLRGIQWAAYVDGRWPEPSLGLAPEFQVLTLSEGGLDCSES